MSRPVCHACGSEDVDVVKDDWAVCGPCKAEWRRRQQKLPRERLSELLDAGIVFACGGCEATIDNQSRWPIVVILSEQGEFAFVRCDRCLIAYAEQQALAAIIRRVEKGESLPTLLADGVEHRLAVTAIGIVRGAAAPATTRPIKGDGSSTSPRLRPSRRRKRKPRQPRKRGAM